MSVLLTPPYLQFEDENGVPLAGGKVFTYAAGTTTPKATYTDSSASQQLPNPIILDAAGRATIWIQGAYKIVVQDAAGVTIRTTDNITSFTVAAAASPSYFQSFSGNGAQTTFTLSQPMGTDPNALMIFVNNSPSVTNTPFFQALANTTIQTAFTVSQDLGTDPNAITVFKATSATTWNIARPVTDYTINGTTLTLTAPIATAYSPGVLVFKNPVLNDTTTGVGLQIQNPSSYTINGTTLTFSTAPKTGTNNILVFAPSSLVGAASQSAAAADASATAAGNSAVIAAQQATSFTGTSATSTLIGTGSKVFTTQLNKNFLPGEFLTIASNANPANYMYGQVTAYDPATGILTVNVTVSGGSGTFTDWNIALSGQQGLPGGGVANGTYGDIVVSGGGLTWNVNKSSQAQATGGTDNTTFMTPLRTKQAIDANPNIILGTVQATTSGTSKDFTAIPAGTKRITINFQNVSTNGTSDIILQIGDTTGYKNTGYLGSASVIAAAIVTVNLNTGFLCPYDNAPSAATVRHGFIVLNLMDSANNIWTANGNFGFSNIARSGMTVGSNSLSNVLDRIRITTVGGTDTFDLGSINIMYEG